ncbi:hypothetical protein ACGFXC_07240 [Streptomyces sp. NPDC048507]|uniref:hypothetical protein n=1 Tax=Streptomyces sp. NPDC048507 TaxID=3365560 RepID=UPI0037204DCC
MPREDRRRVPAGRGRSRPVRRVRPGGPGQFAALAVLLVAGAVLAAGAGRPVVLAVTLAAAAAVCRRALHAAARR